MSKTQQALAELGKDAWKRVTKDLEAIMIDVTAPKTQTVLDYELHCSKCDRKWARKAVAVDGIVTVQRGQCAKCLSPLSANLLSQEPPYTREEPVPPQVAMYLL